MAEDIEALEEAVRALPGNLPLRRQLAEALLGARRWDEALAHYEEISRRADSDGRARLGAARCLFEIGRYPDALARYDEAVRRDPALADAALHDRIARAGADPRARLRLVADGPDPVADPTAPASSPRDPAAPITFADVGGLDDLKEKIRLRVIHPIKRPDLFAAYGKKAGGGLLLYGPPGCGKTFLARATAGEAGLRFMAVGVEDVLDMWLGQSEKRLHEVFREARQQAPTVLFFDEVDALGGRRSALRHESYRTLVTQFLSELDGPRGGREGVLIVGATNAPWDVDPAFRRPGRFTDVLFVPPPDLRARVEILKLKLRGRPQRDIDVAEIARRTELYSGADLENVVEVAVEAALQASLTGGGIRPLTTDELLAAIKRVRPTTREWFAAARNFASYANQAGQYDEVVDYLKRHDLL